MGGPEDWLLCQQFPRHVKGELAASSPSCFPIVSWACCEVRPVLQSPAVGLTPHPFPAPHSLTPAYLPGVGGPFPPALLRMVPHPKLLCACSCLIVYSGL